MIKIQTVAVVGGGGRTGKFVLEQLIAQGFRVKLLHRNPVLFEHRHPNIIVVQGDAMDSHAVGELVKGSDAVINLIGQRKNEPLVAASATGKLLTAMYEHGVSRYLVVTGISLDVPGDSKGFRTKLSSLIMRWIFPHIVADKQQAYEILAKSAVKWTMVRVPYIKFTDVRSRIVTSLSDCPGGQVSSSNIAAFLIEQLLDDRYVCEAPFIANA